MAARTFLLKIEQRGWIQLPARRTVPGYRTRRKRLPSPPEPDGPIAAPPWHARSLPYYLVPEAMRAGRNKEGRERPELRRPKFEVNKPPPQTNKNAQDPGNERFRPMIPCFGRFPPPPPSASSPRPRELAACQSVRYLSSKVEAFIRPEYPNSFSNRTLIAPAIRDSLRASSFHWSSVRCARGVS